MSRLPQLLVHPGNHGVAVYAGELASAVAATEQNLATIAPSDLASLPSGVPLHVHFTDRLWGSSPAEAAESFAALARRHPVSVTLHDVPQASDGPDSLPRRSDAYARVTSLASAVAVNSNHERLLLQEERVWEGPTASIPLAVTVDDAGSARDDSAPAADGSVGVLGFFYPGKGHDEAAQAAAAAGATRMTVLGRASDGHAADLEAFVARASALGLTVDVTGWLDDDEMARRARGVAVPVIAHRHISASGSLASWIGWGRKPVAVRNRYIDEMATLRPGTMTTASDTALAEAVQVALQRPESTWHGLTRVPMQWADVATAYRRWWEGVQW